MCHIDQHLLFLLPFKTKHADLKNKHGGYKQY